MCAKREEIREKAIVKAEGRPRSPHQPNERTRLKRFKDWLHPHLKKSEKLTEAYAEAKVTKETNEANRIAQEAAKIAAQTDLENAKKDIVKQKEVEQFSANIDDIYKDDGLPLQAKQMKMAKLLENNPGIIQQLNRVTEVMEKLESQKKSKFAFVEESESKKVRAIESRVISEETGSCEGCGKSIPKELLPTIGCGQILCSDCLKELRR